MTRVLVEVSAANQSKIDDGNWEKKREKKKTKKKNKQKTIYTTLSSFFAVST